MDIKKFIKERFLSFDCFVFGGRDENPRHWNEVDAINRIQYAKDNPWVLKYDFGHKELIESQPKII